MTTEDSSLVPDYLNRLLLEGRNYIVLGAGLGMGRQTCHALAQAGAAKILCVDIEESRAAAVASEIGVGIPWHGDVTKREEVRHSPLRERHLQEGGIDRCSPVSPK